MNIFQKTYETIVKGNPKKKLPRIVFFMNGIIEYGSSASIDTWKKNCANKSQEP